MIRSARRRHRVAIAVIAALLPVAFAAGLTVRQSEPRVERLPESIAPRPPEIERVVLEDGDLFGEMEIRTRIGYPDGASTATVELDAHDDLVRPDVLVYWSEQEPSGGGIPSRSVLLGAFGGTGARFAVPRETLDRGGWLILYSLGHAEIVATSARVSVSG